MEMCICTGMIHVQMFSVLILSWFSFVPFCDFLGKRLKQVITRYVSLHRGTTNLCLFSNGFPRGATCTLQPHQTPWCLCK